MPGEIDLYHGGGDLAPYSPSQPLAPRADSWGDVPADYLGNDTHGSPTFFGEPMQCSAEQLEQIVGELSGAYQYAFAGQFPQRHISAAIAWLQSQFDQSPRPARTTLNLPREYASDPVAQSFAAHMQAAGANIAFVMKSILWLEEVAAQLNSGGTPAPTPRTAPKFNPDELSDTEFRQLEHINQQAAARTEDILRRKYGQAYEQVIKTADAYLQSLDAASKNHFDQYVTGGVHALNDATTIDGIYQMAIGANNIPSGGQLAAEIKQIEDLMRTDSKAYFRDQQIQSRLLELYRRRDGG